MIARLKAILFDASAEPPPSGEEDEKRTLAAALLIQAALVDGHFADDERAAIRAILCRDHGVDAAEAAALMDEVEDRVRASAQMFGFTSEINRRFDWDDKIGLLETLWEVVLADGVIDSHEGTLMRRLAGLLHVPDRDSARARQRVQAQLDTGS